MISGARLCGSQCLGSLLCAGSSQGGLQAEVDHAVLLADVQDARLYWRPGLGGPTRLHPGMPVSSKALAGLRSSHCPQHLFPGLNNLRTSPKRKILVERLAAAASEVSWSGALKHRACWGKPSPSASCSLA